MQPEHIQQRVAALRQRDAERGQVQARGADFREQLLLLAGGFIVIVVLAEILARLLA